MENDNVAEQEQTEEMRSPERSASILPFAITLTALLIYFAFQTLTLLTERGNLGLVKSSQESALQEAEKVQMQFRALVTKTGELADKGHAGAKMVMEGLQRQGAGLASPPTMPQKADTKPAK